MGPTNAPHASWAHGVVLSRTQRLSPEIEGPRKLLRITPDIFDFEPELGLKRSQTKPKIPSKVTANRDTTIPNNYGPISACFDNDPKL